MLDKLPTILTLAVLVGIFLALQRTRLPTRVRLWTYGWALIFVHFVIQIFEGRSGTIRKHFRSDRSRRAGTCPALVFRRLDVAAQWKTASTGGRCFCFLCVPTAFHVTAVRWNGTTRWALVVR